jgi:ribosomal protein S18 acetylase RimI-like enzyme
MKKKNISIPNIPDLYQLTSKDFSQACDILGQAFRDDPIWVEILKEEPEKFSIVFELPIRYCLKYGKVYGFSPSLEGIAAWLPSNRVKMNIFRLIWSGAFSSAMRLGSKIGKRIQEVFQLIAEDRKANLKGPYVYLYVIGVVPKHQGKGIGTHLIDNMLLHLSPNIPIYLETETERNVRLYERLGFKILKQITIPTLKLPMWEMIHNRK